MIDCIQSLALIALLAIAIATPDPAEYRDRAAKANAQHNVPMVAGNE